MGILSQISQISQLSQIIIVHFFTDKQLRSIDRLRRHNHLKNKGLPPISASNINQI